MNAVKHKIEKNGEHVTEARAISSIEAVPQGEKSSNFIGKKGLLEKRIKAISESPKIRKKVENAIAFLSNLDPDQKW